MIRKLISLPLCVLALLLLMGASAVPQQSDALLAEEESAALDESALETEAQVSIEEVAESDGECYIPDEVPWGLRPIEPEEAAQSQEEAEPLLQVDGVAAPASVGPLCGKWRYLCGSGAYGPVAGQRRDNRLGWEHRHGVQR